MLEKIRANFSVKDNTHIHLKKDIQTMYKLENWSTTSQSDAYTAPECLEIILQGNVYGNPKFRDGDHILTSCIVSMVGRVITTYSGSKYLLGKIDPKFREMLRKIRPNWDWRNPITTVFEQKEGTQTNMEGLSL
jgi:hypothetical protein